MMDARHYELRLFDRTLAEFSLADGAFGPQVELTDFDDTAMHLMPCGLAPNADSLWRWLEVRSIPANRKNAQRLCHELGFRFGDLEALYKVSLGLSLTDSYWIVPRGFAGTFDEYNLFDNPFSEAIGALAVTGEAREVALRGNTPELTTDGSLRKGWRIMGGRRMLYKGAGDGMDPGEPISEYVASLIARDLGLTAVKYGLDSWEGEMCSTCPCFTRKDVSYVPFAVATGARNLAEVLAWCSAKGSLHVEAICDMLTFDALVCNTDRHLTNFGVLRDNATGRFIGLAPIFDNGRALFPNIAENDTAQFMLEASIGRPAFGAGSFAEMVARVAGTQQRQMLERAGERGIIGNVSAPRPRVAELDTFIRRHAEELLKTEPVDHDEMRERLLDVSIREDAWNEGAVRL